MIKPIPIELSELVGPLPSVSKTIEEVAEAMVEYVKERNVHVITSFSNIALQARPETTSAEIIHCFSKAKHRRFEINRSKRRTPQSLLGL